MIAGMTEVAFFIGRYLDALDLTREAARFASVRDPFDVSANGDLDCSTPDSFNFYYDTACIFSPPAPKAGDPPCTDPKFCNGFNPYILLDPGTDDIVITAFTVTNQVVTQTHPQPIGYYAFSNRTRDPSLVDRENWKRDCQGNLTNTPPYYTAASIDRLLLSDPNMTTSKGFVTVEFYYCYHQVLNLPIISDVLPNPLRIHVYTAMPLPAAQPTPTPIP